MNISGEAGDMGILANHVPSIEALRPGVVEVIEASGSKKWFGEQQQCLCPCLCSHIILLQSLVDSQQSIQTID